MKAPLSTLGVKQEMLMGGAFLYVNYEAVIVSTAKRPK